MGENSIESRQRGYCEGGKISKVGGYILGHLPPGVSYSGGGYTVTPAAKERTYITDCWTYNGRVKIKTASNVVHTVAVLVYAASVAEYTD